VEDDIDSAPKMKKRQKKQGPPPASDRDVIDLDSEVEIFAHQSSSSASATSSSSSPPSVQVLATSSPPLATESMWQLTSAICCPGEPGPSTATSSTSSSPPSVQVLPATITSSSSPPLATENMQLTSATCQAASTSPPGHSGKFFIYYRLQAP